MPSFDESPRGLMAESLGQELMLLHTESYGRGAKRVRVYFLDDLVVCLLDEIELLPNEEFLIENGHATSVLEVRARYQQAIEATFRAAVERATGRRVTAFTSSSHLSPNYSIESFRLERASSTTLAEPDER